MRISFAWEMCPCTLLLDLPSSNRRISDFMEHNLSAEVMINSEISPFIRKVEGWVFSSSLDPAWRWFWQFTVMWWCWFGLLVMTTIQIGCSKVIKDRVYKITHANIKHVLMDFILWVLYSFVTTNFCIKIKNNCNFPRKGVTSIGLVQTVNHEGHAQIWISPLLLPVRGG